MWLGAFRIVEQASRQVSLESVVNGSVAAARAEGACASRGLEGCGPGLLA